MISHDVSRKSFCQTVHFPSKIPAAWLSNQDLLPTLRGEEEVWCVVGGSGSSGEVNTTLFVAVDLAKSEKKALPSVRLPASI